MPAFARWASRSVSSLSTYAAAAETPNAIEPTMFSVAIDQPRSSGRHRSHGRRTSAYASALATRKAIEPSTSGVQTRWSAWSALSDAFSASKVLTLNSRVPTNCTPPAHRSRAVGRQPQLQSRPPR